MPCLADGANISNGISPETGRVGERERESAVRGAERSYFGAIRYWERPTREPT